MRDQKKRGDDDEEEEEEQEEEDNMELELDVGVVLLGQLASMLVVGGVLGMPLVVQAHYNYGEANDNGVT